MDYDDEEDCCEGWDMEEDDDDEADDIELIDYDDPL